MEEIRKEQIEALEVFCNFNERFINNVHTLIKELEGERKEDTDKFLEEIIKEINWEIGVLNGNGMMALINEKKEHIQKADFNNNISKLSKALEEKNDSKIAEALKEALPMFENLGKIAKEILEADK